MSSVCIANRTRGGKGDIRDPSRSRPEISYHKVPLGKRDLPPKLVNLGDRSIPVAAEGYGAVVDVDRRRRLVAADFVHFNPVPREPCFDRLAAGCGGCGRWHRVRRATRSPPTARRSTRACDARACDAARRRWQCLHTKAGRILISRSPRFIALVSSGSLRQPGRDSNKRSHPNQPDRARGRFS